MNDPSYSIVTVAAGNHLRSATAAWDGIRSVDHAASTNDACRRIASSSSPPDLILLRSGSASAPRDGAALSAVAPSAQLLILLPSTELARFRAGLPFMPGIRRAWSGAESSTPAQLHAMLTSALESARARSEHATVMARINARLSPAPALPAVVAGPGRLSERYFITLLSTAPDAFFALNADGVFLALNDAAASLFTVGDMDATIQLDEIVERGSAEHIRALIDRVAIGEIVRHVELRMRGRKGEPERWIELSLAPVIDDEGHVESLSGTAREITERRAADAALHALNETLEERVTTVVAERELAQEALRQAQKMEAMGQLTGGVAHDFNNLLTPIIGSLDLMQRRGGHTDREARLINGALQSAERAKTLVQRLLAFARRQPLQTGPVDIATLLSGMAGLIASTSGPNVRVETDLPDTLVPALADANQLEMAILNLAVNARDAMPDGGTLTIAAGIAQAPRNLAGKLAGKPALRLTVADTGKGMDADTVRRATEPFFSTKGVGKGTGLGLSMVHGLTQQLGGDLTISSRPDIGTRIDLWLPATDPVPSEVEVPQPHVPRGRFHGKALVVDDEAIVRLTTAGMLESLGYSTVEADSAVTAEKLLQTGETFDLIVTDHLMPGRTGAELAQKIRRSWPSLPVLIISGYADVDAIAPNLPRLAKPFREAELAEAISNLS